MTSDSSATALEQTPHATETSTTHFNIALKRRAQSLIKDRTIDAQTRNLISYAFEINDPCLPAIVCGVDAHQSIDMIDLAATPEPDTSSDEKVEALVETICHAGEEAAAALLILMSTVETSTHPKVLANVAKHLTFTHCGELNLNGIVDVEIALLEGELLDDHIVAV